MTGEQRPYLGAGDRPELPALTGLRALASLAAILWHADYFFDMGRVLGPTYLGVDLFFILSGFILTYVHGEDEGPLLRRHARFMMLRLGRIWPAYLVAMLIVAGFSGLVAATGLRPSGPLIDVLPQFPFYLLMLQSWVYVFPSVFNPPAWSVSAELLVYLLFPLFLMLVGRARSARGSLVALFACFAAGAVSVMAMGAPDLNLIGQPGLVRVAFEFGMGVALCRLWRSGAPAELPWRWLGPAAIAALIAAAAIDEPLLRDFAMLAAFPLLLLAMAMNSDVLSRALARRTMVFLGEISYAVYLVHYFVLQRVQGAQAMLEPFLPAFLRSVLAGLAATLLISVLLGWLLNVAVERPCRRWARRQAWKLAP